MNFDRVMPYFAPLLRRMLRPFQARREALFAAAPLTPGRVVFLGDSITEGAEWEDWFPELHTANRGIGGQAIKDVLARLDTALIEPSLVSLLIGTNDLHGLGLSSNVSRIAEQASELVRRIRTMAPSTPLLVNSVLPRTAHFRDRILQLNAAYRDIAEAEGATYVDVWPAVAGSDGAIRPDLTTDGLHLSAAGYKAWVDVLRPYIAHLSKTTAPASME